MRVFLLSLVGVVFLSFLFLPGHAQASNAMPSNLVRAIGTYESGWNQSVRGRSGEVGIMQVLPSTARSLNATYRTNYNVYSASGNVALGALYLHKLWNDFGGDVAKVVSGYNAGPWTVMHRGIRNWRYVNGVLSLMRRI